MRAGRSIGRDGDLPGARTGSGRSEGDTDGTVGAGRQRSAAIVGLRKVSTGNDASDG